MNISHYIAIPLLRNCHKEKLNALEKLSYVFIFVIDFFCTRCTVILQYFFVIV